MKVWIDQDLCTGDGLCAEICPDIFIMRDDGLAYVQENGHIFEDPGGALGLANFEEEQPASPCYKTDSVDIDTAGRSWFESPEHRAYVAGCCRTSDMHVKLRRSRFYWDVW